MGFMKKYLLMIMLLFCMGCNVQKHLEVERVKSTKTELKVNETNNRNTTRFIVITKYKDSTDSLGNQTVESVTKIKEVNKDVITTDTDEKTNTDEEETIKEDKIVKSDWKIYLWCFLGGIGFMLLVILIIRLIRWYIRRRGV